MSDFTRPKQVVKDWKDIFPNEAQKPAAKRTGAISSRPAVSTQAPPDDPWRVGNQHARRSVDRLANGATVAGFVRDYTTGSNGYESPSVQSNDYPSPTSNPATPTPFQVRHVEGNVYSVHAGTCEGQLITTQEINVGSARPVAILAYPQYTLNIYNSEYVWSATVKTGASAPILMTSTSVFSDQTLVDSSGTGARALIAYIYEVDGASNVAQIAQGNISGVFADDGSLTGKIGGSYNKNF